MIYNRKLYTATSYMNGFIKKYLLKNTVKAIAENAMMM